MCSIRASSFFCGATSRSAPARASGPRDWPPSTSGTQSAVHRAPPARVIRRRRERVAPLPARPVTQHPGMTDDEIVAAIAAAVHEPYRVVWRVHDDREWQPVRRVLAHAVRAHEQARDDLAADGTRSAYRRRTARDVLKPLRLALRRSKLAVQLHDRLASTPKRCARRWRPAGVVRGPVAPTALHGRAGLGAGNRIRRFLPAPCARSCGAAGSTKSPCPAWRAPIWSRT